MLRRTDRDLDALVKCHGVPSFWTRPPGFATLVRIILEQQVSLASARAVYRKLRQRVDGRLTARGLLALDRRALRACGFSRQKATYCRELAAAVASRRLGLAGLKRLDDAAARARLLEVRGIGPWTADIYLLAALRRPDVWPVADLALVRAVHELKGLRRTPPPEQTLRISRTWAPWRSVAARLCWHHYLSVRGLAS